MKYTPKRPNFNLSMGRIVSGVGLAIELSI